MAYLPGGLLGFGPIATLPIGDDIIQLAASDTAAVADDKTVLIRCRTR